MVHDWKEQLRSSRATWLVTGAAGFIGSHLVEALLNAGQEVRGIDNFFSGSYDNLREVEARVGKDAWKRFFFVEGDIRDPLAIDSLCVGTKYVLHQAAMASVEESQRKPELAKDINLQGTIKVFEASKAAGVKRIIFASSSAVYGDGLELPKVETMLAAPRSVYAMTKLGCEHEASRFYQLHGLEFIALRYFNVYGQRQNPTSPYSGVISIFCDKIAKQEKVWFNGDGENTRDFVSVQDIVQANVLGAIVDGAEVVSRPYNIATGRSVTLLELYAGIRQAALACRADLKIPQPGYREAREGDIRHSSADISAARVKLGYAPSISLESGLADLLKSFL